MTRLLLTDLNREVLRLTLNRPEQSNALSLKLLDALHEALEEYRQARELKCVVITAAGERCFAAGGDLK